MFWGLLVFVFFKRQSGKRSLHPRTLARENLGWELQNPGLIQGPKMQHPL